MQNGESVKSKNEFCAKLLKVRKIPPSTEGIIENIK